MTAVIRSRPMPVSIDGAGSGLQRAVRLAIELHEDVVPDLDESVAAAIEPAARPPRALLVARQLVAAEVVDLGAAAARTGVAHRPEVLRQRRAR